MKKINPDYSDGLTYALCALSCFRNRHAYKHKGSRKGVLVKNRIKDLSRSGEMRRGCRMFIRDARAAGFHGSIRGQVLEKSVAPCA